MTCQPATLLDLKRIALLQASAVSDPIWALIYPHHLVDRNELAVFFYERSLHTLAWKQAGKYGLTTINNPLGGFGACASWILVESNSILENFMAASATSPPKATNLRGGLAYQAGLLRLQERQAPLLSQIGKFLQLEIWTPHGADEHSLVTPLLEWAAGAAAANNLPEMPVVTVVPNLFQTAYANGGFVDADIETIDFGGVFVQLLLKIKLPENTQTQVMIPAQPQTKQLLPQHLQDPTTLTRF